MMHARIVRFAALASGALALSSVLGTHPAATPSTTSTRAVASTTYPTNSAKIFRWGNAQWHDEFVTPLSSMWRVSDSSLVRDQHGMLTLDSTATSGSVVATVVGHNRQYGRWEARVRGRQYGTSGTPYRAVWELAPARGGYHCAAKNLVLSDYVLGSNRVDLHVRNLPDLDFRDARTLSLDDNQFHTYAVEVTPDHVSWFIDTRVVMTERRDAARSGAVYTARFRLVGRSGARMNQGRMQMDWMRYYSLERPNAKPITAPAATRDTYADAC